VKVFEWHFHRVIFAVGALRLINFLSYVHDYISEEPSNILNKRTNKIAQQKYLVAQCRY